MATQSSEPFEFNPALFARYLSGEADRVERAIVERWIEADPANRILAETMRAAWDRPRAPEFDADGAVWERIQRQIGAVEARPTLVRPAPQVEPRGESHVNTAVRRVRPWFAAAAVAMIAAGSVLIAKLNIPSFGVDATSNAAAPVREIATRRGERLALRLGDGTRVVLGPDSRLHLTNEFNARSTGPREVRLEGEALFEVVHDSTRPFRVFTKDAIAEDLGTEFVVTSYPETRGTRVVVASGVVAMHRPTERTGPALLTLERGDLGTVANDQVTAFVRHVAITPYLSWATGTLQFDGTPLREAIPALSRWYDIDLRLADSALADKALTATFTDEPISQVLALVAMTLDLTLEHHGKTATLRAQ